MTTFGPFNVSEPRTFRAVCSDGTTTIFGDAFTVDPQASCGACEILINPVDASGPVGTAIPTDMGGQSSDVAIWQESSSPTGPWSTISGPPTVINAQTDGMYYRFCCADDLTNCSTVAQVTQTAVGADQLTRSDADGILPSDGSTVSEQYCLACDDAVPVFRWEIRIDDPNAGDPDAMVSATGFQPLAQFDGQQCVDLFIRLEVDPFDPTTRTGLSDLDEMFTYYIRGSCDGGTTWLPELQATVVYDHPDDGTI